MNTNNLNPQRPIQKRFRACLKNRRGAAAREFGCGRSGEGRASPQRAVRAEPTKAAAKGAAAQRFFAPGAAWLRCSSVTERWRLCSFVAPRHTTLGAKTAPLLFFKQALVFTALTFGLALSAQAQDFDGDSPIPKPIAQTTRFGISPFFGYRFGGEVEDANTGTTYDFEDSPAYGVFLDYAPINYKGRFEFLWSRQDSSMDFHGNNGLGKVDLTIDVIQVGGVAEFGAESLRGYVSAHVGATHYSSGGYGDDTKFSFGIGGGVKAYLTKNVYLRADVRGLCTVVEAEGSFIYWNGVTVATFSGSTLWQGQASVGFGITF